MVRDDSCAAICWGNLESTPVLEVGRNPRGPEGVVPDLCPHQHEEGGWLWCGAYVSQDIDATIYPSGLCLVMESLRGFGSEISDRVVQNPRTSRDIVLCRLQAVQKRGESIAESSPGYIAAHSVTSQTVRDVLQKSLPALAIGLLGCR